MKPKFCVTLTTIPSRLSSLDKTIKSIEDQTLRPNKIFLNSFQMVKDKIFFYFTIV